MTVTDEQLDEEIAKAEQRIRVLERSLLAAQGAYQALTALKATIEVPA